MIAAAMLLYVLALVAKTNDAEAFMPFARKRSLPCSLSSLPMVPRFDAAEKKWLPQTDDDLPEAGYPPIGSLFRQGPKAFLQRVFNSGMYEQSVLKYMASEQCSRKEAQGNMDGKLSLFCRKVIYCTVL